MFYSELPWCTCSGCGDLAAGVSSRRLLSESRWQPLNCNICSATELSKRREPHTAATEQGGFPFPRRITAGQGCPTQQKQGLLQPVLGEVRDKKKHSCGGGRYCGLISWWLGQADSYSCSWDPKIWPRRPLNGLVKPRFLELTWK